MREILRSGGRTLAQGALAWIWRKSNKTIPIPGFKTVKQAIENANALNFGPLSSDQMQEIERLWSSSSVDRNYPASPPKLLR